MILEKQLSVIGESPLQPAREKLTAIRQCVEKIGINKLVGEIMLAIRTVPVGNLQATQEIKIFV